MTPSEKYTYRIFWQKTGNAKYVSHLDTQRAVMRALTRSGLPLYYTQGFNPHPKLIFALPLSLFQEANYDVFDVALAESLPAKKVCEKLAAAMPPGMRVLRAGFPRKKASELAWASYSVYLETELSEAELAEKFAGSVIVEKKSKKKCGSADIAPLIKGLSFEKAGCGVLMRVTLPASPDEYLNPKYLVDFLGSAVKFSQTVRDMLYDADMKPFE